MLAGDRHRPSARTDRRAGECAGVRMCSAERRLEGTCNNAGRARPRGGGKGRGTHRCASARRAFASPNSSPNPSSFPLRVMDGCGAGRERKNRDGEKTRHDSLKVERNEKKNAFSLLLPSGRLCAVGEKSIDLRCCLLPAVPSIDGECAWNERNDGHPIDRSTGQRRAEAPPPHTRPGARASPGASAARHPCGTQEVYVIS